MSLRDEGSVGVSVIARYEFITKKQITPKPHNMMKTTARNSVFSLLITLSALALSATANAALLNDGAYNGTYTSTSYIWDPLFNFTFDSGKVYGISANMSVSAITWTANDQGANATFLSFGNTNTGGEFAFQNGAVGIGQNIYTYAGNVNLFAQPITAGFSTTYTGGSNLDKGAAPQTLNVGFSLDTTGPTWAVNYYQGGTGFNDTAVYQGGTLLGTSTGIAAGTFKGIYLFYNPWSATGAQAQSVVSNFKVVDSVPEPSTYALVIGGIATLLLIRRRVQA
jgi:hypothetical protein